MKINFSVFTLAFIGLFFIKCSTIKPTLPTKEYMEANPPNPVKIGGLVAIQKYYIHIDTMIKTGADTLGFSCSSTFSFFPFGESTSKRRFASDLLNNFKVSDTTITTDDGHILLEIFKHKSSKLLFSFNKPYIYSHSEILKGEIYDSDVRLINGVQIGMSTDDFYKCFFDYFPDELKKRYKYFVIQSCCIQNVTQIYALENNKLQSVKFTSDRPDQIEY